MRMTLAREREREKLFTKKKIFTNLEGLADADDVGQLQCPVVPNLARTHAQLSYGAVVAEGVGNGGCAARAEVVEGDFYLLAHAVHQQKVVHRYLFKRTHSMVREHILW